MRQHRPVHPGEVLEQYIPEGVTTTALAEALEVPRVNLTRVIKGKLGVSAILAVKLSEVLPATSPEFWMNLQSNYELAKVQQEKRKKLKPLPVAGQRPDDVVAREVA